MCYVCYMVRLAITIQNSEPQANLLVSFATLILSPPTKHTDGLRPSYPMVVPSLCFLGAHWANKTIDFALHVLFVIEFLLNYLLISVHLRSKSIWFHSKLFIPVITHRAILTNYNLTELLQWTSPYDDTSDVMTSRVLLLSRNILSYISSKYTHHTKIVPSSCS